ncbi:MAG: MBL fold metallo-hydrolase [Deltaproteobacteria bacterium]|nr:MBL fold metallo-hydrolase [Deltaproteobacteria bacterium]
MIIRCHGARGSIPVSGPEYVKYGGDTTCLEIRTQNDEIIIVDAGSGIRRLGNRLIEEGKYHYHLIFTHSHLDHILGFPFFKPIYHPEAIIHLMGCPTTQGNIQKLLSKAMSAPLFPIQFEALQATIDYDVECRFDYQIDSIEIHPINLNHPNGGMGYKFVEDGKTFVFLTDNELGSKHRNGLSFEDYLAFSKDADLLIHDSEYTADEYRLTKGWGHSTYPDALELAQKARVKKFGLFHHNQNRTDADQDMIVEQCRSINARKGINMACFALTQTTTLTL